MSRFVADKYGLAVISAGPLTNLVDMGAGYDGGHHKQWCLVRIAELLGLDITNYEEGIPP